MEHRFLITTDHFQFFLADEGYTTDTADIWTDEAFENQMACGEDLVAIGTARYGGETNVIVDILEKEPEAHTENVSGAHACIIRIPSGVLVLFSPESDFDASPKILVSPGSYKVLVTFEDLESIDDENALLGDDKYRVILQKVYDTSL